MKKYIALLALSVLNVFGNIATAKDKDDYQVVVVKDESGSYSYQSVVNVDNVSKEEMFKRAKEWVLTNFKTDDNNIKFDESNMEIISTTTAVLKTASGFNWAITHCLCNFKLNIQFKDGKYKFVFNNIAVQAAYADGIVETLNYEQVQRNNAPAKHIRKEVNEKLLSLGNQLENAIKNGSKSKDDW